MNESVLSYPTPETLVIRIPWRRLPLDFLLASVVFFAFFVTVTIILPDEAPLFVRALFPAVPLVLCGVSFIAYSNRRIFPQRITRKPGGFVTERLWGDRVVLRREVSASDVAKAKVDFYVYRVQNTTGHASTYTKGRTIKVILKDGSKVLLGGFLTPDEASEVSRFIAPALRPA